MNKYNNACIYGIYVDDEIIYVGSTTNLKKRINYHIENINKKDLKIYRYIRDNGLKNKIVIKKIIDYSCNNKTELFKKEGEYIKYYMNNGNIKNEYIAGRTDKEYREDNKEKIKETKKKYYEKNKDIIIDYNKKYHHKNKEKIKEKKRQYHHKNKDRLNKYSNQYYKENKEKLIAFRLKKYICDCGVIYSHQHHLRHSRTKHHINYMNNPFYNLNC